MKTIKPSNDFHAGTDIVKFTAMLNEELRDYPDVDILLDLSDVIYMDSFTFRLVFNFLPRLRKVIPPKDQLIVGMYNMWLDSKKGLSK